MASQSDLHLNDSASLSVVQSIPVISGPSKDSMVQSTAPEKAAGVTTPTLEQKSRLTREASSSNTPENAESVGILERREMDYQASLTLCLGSSSAR